MAQIIALRAHQSPPVDQEFILVSIDNLGFPLVSHAKSGTTFLSPNTPGEIGAALDGACALADERDLVVYLEHKAQTTQATDPAPATEPRQKRSRD